MLKKYTYCSLLFWTLCTWGWGQDTDYNRVDTDAAYSKARSLALDGNHKSAKQLLTEVVSKNPKNTGAGALLASTYSWSGEYEKARGTFNRVLSKEKKDRDVWISAVKNELYAKNSPTALGLANKALVYLKSDPEIERLREMALENIQHHRDPKPTYKHKKIESGQGSTDLKRNEVHIGEKGSVERKTAEVRPKNPVDKEAMNNRVGIRNAFTVFDQRYDPMVYSSISFRRQTLAGSIIPRINYSNRLGKHGVQYDLDFYPKFSKRFYAYLNYGYSSASIYPNHKVGGDLYVNLPGAFEFSAGGRFISFDTQNVKVITNSLGHYRGNYYFSLRSYITPRPDNLTRVSGNILVRKYLKDAENYMGVNFGMGISPELRQITSGDEILAETFLYVESQQLRVEYQFTGKKNPNIYRANLGMRRQELVYDSGSFFWALSAGLTYQVKF